ncbi:MAG TPA: NAD-dependent epimerase/dehydratase family protein [Holophaga sp.]|nr:NAD-dependent epimerase/dehydratase family protein [Holophaga sp.]
MHVLIVGCGWLGGAVAEALVARGDRVTGVRRDPGRAQALRALGAEPLALDLAGPEALAALPEDLDAILALQSAREDSREAYTRTYVQTGANLLAAARGRRLRAVVQASSTGVFGQRDGAWVDEGSPVAPATPTAEVLAAAEALYLEAARNGIPARVLRLSGLYGPGRTWMLDRVRSGALALGPGDGAWLNSCHRDDAVTALLAVLDRGRDGAVYHATDAEPLRRRELIQWLSERLGIPAPVNPGAQPSGPDRRVSGAATRQELGLHLRWPSLREGLAPFLA